MVSIPNYSKSMVDRVEIRDPVTVKIGQRVLSSS